MSTMSAMDPRKVTWSETQFVRFFGVDKSNFRDPWATFLFFANLSAFFVVTGLAVDAFVKTRPQTDGHSITLDANSLIMFAIVIASAIILCAAYFSIARAFTKQFIWITGIMNIAVGFATAIYYLSEKIYPAGIVFMLFSAFYLIAFISWIPRIKLSTIFLQLVMDISSMFISVYIVAALGMLCNALFAAWFSVALVSSYIKYHENSPGCDYPGGPCGDASLVMMLLYLVFSSYWISEVIKNVAYVTISGIFGSFYYGYNSANGIPKNAAVGSFRRASTYSFGSISLGSLVVSVISFLRDVIGSAARSFMNENNLIMFCLSCFLQYILSVIDFLARYFTRYVFVQVALFGKKYMQAARDTRDLVVHRGIDALINDSLIFPVLTMGSVFVAYISALISYIFLRFTNPDYNDGGSYYPVVMAVSFLFGLQIGNTAVTAISAGVATIFVAIADRPDLLQRNFPEIWNKMYQSYPYILSNA